MLLNGFRIKAHRKETALIETLYTYTLGPDYST